MNKKHSYAYIFIIFSILTISALVIYYGIIAQWEGTIKSYHPTFSKVFLIWNGVVSIVFTSVALPKAILVIFYWISLPQITKQNKEINKIKTLSKKPNVAFVYCTCDDFDEYSVKKSLEQNYGNYKMFILDDSKKLESIKTIDKFGKKNNIEIIRRASKTGFKAGNLNNFLKQNMWWDFFVILDADEIIEKNFLNKCLPLFEKNTKLGFIQANHKGTRSKNFFTQYLSKSILPGFSAVESSRNLFGSAMCMGHGCIISRTAYEDIGGFREDTISEDWVFSVLLKNKGWESMFLNDLVCEEEFPVNFISYKKRQARWWKGSAQLVKKHTLNIFKMKTTWFEKTDAFFIINCAFLGGFSGLLSFINILVISLLKIDISLLIFMIPITVAFTIIPLLSDFFILWKKINFFQVILYFLMVWLACSATVYAIAKAVFQMLFGVKTIFTPTIKQNQNFKIWQCFAYNFGELFTASIILVFALLAFFLLGNFVVLSTCFAVVIPLFLTPLLTYMSNFKTKKWKWKHE